MSLNFDFSQLDKLPEGSTAKKGPKFQPKFLAKPRAATAAPPAQASAAAPASAAEPASQPPAKKQAAPSSSPLKPAAVVPPKRQAEQPQVHVEPKPATTKATSASNRAPKRPRKQAQPLPAAADFPGGLAIEPEAANAAQHRRDAAASDDAEDNEVEEHYEKLRPAKSLSARAQARQAAALTQRKRGRPRKTAPAPQNEREDGDEEEEELTATPTARKVKKSTTTRQPTRFSTEAEKKEAGIRRPSRSRRDYDKGLILDYDHELYEYENHVNDTDDEATEDDTQYIYTRIDKGRKKVEEESIEVDANGAGPSKPQGGARGKVGRPRKDGKPPRKGEPLSTYKTKLKKISDDKSKRKVASLADEELDPDNWSMKKIISWTGSRERKLKAEERKARIERQKKVASDLALAAAGGAGTSADAQQQHPNRGAGAAAAAGGSGSRPPHGVTAQSPSGALALGAGPSTGVAPSGSQQQQNRKASNANLAPQVQVVDGRIVVNRQSLTVQAQEREQYTRIVTEDTSRLNSMTYMNRISNERWTTEDTELFYKALSQFGTDFTLISHLFPGRERRHLKNKYTRENKIHPERVDDAMRLSSNGAINSYNDMIVMLKESGMAVSAGAAAAAGVASPTAGPVGGAAAVLNGIPSVARPGSGGTTSNRGGGNTAAAAPLAITEAGEPETQPEEEEIDEEEEAAAVVAAAAAAQTGRGRGRKARTAAS